MQPPDLRVRLAVMPQNIELIVQSLGFHGRVETEITLVVPGILGVEHGVQVTGDEFLVGCVDFIGQALQLDMAGQLVAGFDQAVEVSAQPIRILHQQHHFGIGVADNQVEHRVAKLLIVVYGGV